MDNPYLIQIDSTLGSEEAMVFMTGYLTENDCEFHHHQPWIDNLRKAGWRGSIYYLWWDSSNPKNSKSILWQAPPLGNLAHWDKHKCRAKRVGKFFLEDLISNEIKEPSISLIGHSLGARIIFFTARNWSINSSHSLKNIILMGGAIPKNRNWGKVASRLRGKLFNIYNGRDPVLQGVYRVTTFGLKPCGLKPIEKCHFRINNLEVTSFIEQSHDLESYLRTLPKLAQRGEIGL